MVPERLVSFSLSRCLHVRPAALIGALLGFGIVRALTVSAYANAAAAPSPAPVTSATPRAMATAPAAIQASASPVAPNDSENTVMSPVDGTVPLRPPTVPASGPIIAPTPVPLLLIPGALSLAPNTSYMVHTQGAYGQIRAGSDNEQIARASADQNDRTIRIDAFRLGHANVSVTDQRGVTRNVPITVLPLAGQLAFLTSARLTGTPASELFVAETAQLAAIAAANRPANVTAVVDPSAIHAGVLQPDNSMDVKVPLTLTAPGYIPVSGMTIVRVDNVAQPPVKPNSLIVSDFPERLTASGLLFTSRLDPTAPTRLLFYHYNPKGQPNRHIVLRVKNTSQTQANLQLVDGHGGPSGNEMLVGHLAAERFLVRSQQNEGVLINVPGATTMTLVDAGLPAGTIVNDMMQIREIDGDPLQLILTAEDVGVAQPATTFDDTTPYLTAAEHHARGVYPIPHFYYETTYAVGQPPLAIPLGELPLPNLRQGEALVGDYGVQITIDAAISNPTGQPEPIALYANPRGGRATGTFLIDRTLVRAHALKTFTNFKLRQYVVPPHGIVNVHVDTMPEGGSSYPVNLIFAPDDGSVAPGAPGSPIY